MHNSAVPSASLTRCVRGVGHWMGSCFRGPSAAEILHTIVVDGYAGAIPP